MSQWRWIGCGLRVLIMILGNSSMKRRKYGNRKVEVLGHKFDSVKEGRRYNELLLLLRAGKISDLKLQPEFPITIALKPVVIRSKAYPNGRKVKYKADFSYVDNKTGKVVVEDVKGMDLPVSRLKRAIVEAIYGVRVVII